VKPADVVAPSSEHLLIVQADFVSEGSFARMWYLSDSLNFAKVTYVCDESAKGPELEEADRIVSTLRFARLGAA